jgi:hypothetical protein
LIWVRERMPRKWASAISFDQIGSGAPEIAGLDCWYSRPCQWLIGGSIMNAFEQHEIDFFLGQGVGLVGHD